MKKILFVMSIFLVIAVAGCTAEHEHDDHDHSVEIEGKDMKLLTVQDVADLWEIDSDILLSGIVAEFNLNGSYSVNTVLEDIREAEYKFSPAQIKDLAEEIKQEGLQNE